MNTEEKRSFNKELITLAIPLALQQLLNALVGATDALMLGRLAQESIAAVSLANQVSFLLSLINSSVIGAASILIAQYWGKRDCGRARQFLALAMRYVALASLTFSLLAFCLPERLMRIFTPEEELIAIGASYLRIVSGSYLLAGVSQCYLMVMKISGAARMSVWISAMTVMVDVAADFFLIYGVGSFAGFQADGAAYSTVAVEALALTWCILWARRKKEVRPQLGDFTSFSPAREREMWRLIPGILASYLSWGVSMSVHSVLMGHLGTDITAAYAVTGVAQQLIQGVTHGLSAGAGIMIGQLLGRSELEKARAYGRRFWMVAAISGAINVMLIAMAGPLVYFFYALAPLAKTYLVQMLIMSALYMFALAYNTIITCGVFPAGGDAKYDAISVFFATWCFAIPLALLGCFVLHWPPMLVYVVMCLDEIVKVPFIKRRYDRYIWLKNLTTE